MSDTKFKNAIIGLVLYTVALFFTISSFISIFSEVNNFRFWRNNHFTGAVFPNWSERDNQFITLGTIAFLLIFMTLIFIGFSYFAKQSSKISRNTKKITELLVIIMSMVTIIFLIFAIIYLRLNLPVAEWSSTPNAIYANSFQLFLGFKALLLQPVMTLLIVLVFHLCNFLTIYKEKKVES